jgi:GNAT superfamily N-acetyltransferase
LGPNYGRVVTIRKATFDDVPAIGDLIRELADYEHAAREAVASDDDLAAALFGEDPVVYCHLAEADGQAVGLALWFLNFSTWLGISGIYLEDLYVRETFRGRGLGTALMKELARICVERGYRRLQWSVLDWNTPSIEFYESIGATAMDEWTTYRLEGGALEAYGGAT